MVALRPSHRGDRFSFMSPKISPNHRSTGPNRIITLNTVNLINDNPVA
jgi:hypothetical protein